MVRPRVNPTLWPLAPTVHLADDIPTTSQSMYGVPSHSPIVKNAPVSYAKVEAKAFATTSSAPKQVILSVSIF